MGSAEDRRREAENRRRDAEWDREERALEKLEEEIIQHERYDQFVCAALTGTPSGVRNFTTFGPREVAVIACDVADAVMAEIAKRHKKRKKTK